MHFGEPRWAPKWSPEWSPTGLAEVAKMPTEQRGSVIPKVSWIAGEGIPGVPNGGPLVTIEDHLDNHGHTGRRFPRLRRIGDLVLIGLSL